MLRRIISINLVLCALLLGLAVLPGRSVFALTATPTQTPCTALTITGLVYSASQPGVAGATVIADTSVSHPFSTTTAADGTYTLSIPATSNYACLVTGLRVTATGYLPASRTISSAALRTQPVQNFGLTGTTAVATATRTRTPTASPTIVGDIGYRTIAGTVRDVNTGAAIAGATVTCSHFSYTSNVRCTGTTTTAANGSYTFGSVYIRDTDSITIGVQAAGYTAQSVVRGGVSFVGSGIVNFSLVASGTITATPTATNTPAPFLSGYVRLGSSTGPGLANVNVCYWLAGYTFNCAANTVLTDQSGYYQMNICVPQQETVTIQASLSPYAFTPASYVSTQYAGCKTGSYDFVATADGTPTRTPTPNAVITNTPTRTPTPTPVTTGTCSPVSATIAAPFTKDGSGSFCWQSANLGGYINSWNTSSVTINGVNITNQYVASGSYPAKIGGFWYVSYTSSVAWAHFEAK